jgi:hypothetical protein
MDIPVCIKYNLLNMFVILSNIIWLKSLAFKTKVNIKFIGRTPKQNNVVC